MIPPFLKYFLLLISVNFFLACQSGKTEKPFKTNTKYNRKNWSHWVDRDRDCQNERHEILIKESKVPVQFRTKKKCLVSMGKWYGVYSGKYFYKSSDLDIDHVIPLKEAYLSGGKNWTKAKKKEFANDPENLLPVDKWLNRKKGAKDIAQWLPPREDFICDYFRKWVRVKRKYDLDLDAAEMEKTSELKKACLE